MEDKRTAFAIFACILVIMVYSELFLAPVTRPTLPPQGQQAASTQSTQSTSVANPANTAPSVSNTRIDTATPVAEQLNRHPNHAELEAAKSTHIDSPEASIVITHLGARLAKFQLRNYKLHLDGDDLVDLVSASDNTPLPLGAYVGNVNDEFVQYTLTATSAGAPEAGGNFGVPSTGELSLTFSGTLPNHVGIKKIYTFRPGTYLFSVKVELDAASSDASRISLEWTHYAADTEINSRLDPPKFSYLNAAGKLHHLMAPEVVKTAIEANRPLSDIGANKWVELGGKYFMAALIPLEATPSSYAGIEKNTLMARAFGTEREGSFDVYVGPKDYKILKGLAHELHRSIDLGWFSFLAFPLISVIRLFQELLGNYGLAIILLTLTIKTLFLPLTKASFSSMKAMQEIQPEIKALRERIKDATQLNQEMMALYKRRGVNPMGGCLPILIQLPVFLGLYNALLNSIELRHAPFALWIKDLSAPEALHVFGLGVPVMVLLMGASMFLQQLTTPATGDPAQRKAMLMMPIVFTVMFVIFPFPAGLVLYWLVNNMISITQQVYLRHERKANPMQATIIASIGIFCFGWVLTLIK